MVKLSELAKIRASSFRLMNLESPKHPEIKMRIFSCENVLYSDR